MRKLLVVATLLVLVPAFCLAAEKACPDIASDICRMIQEQEI